MSGPHVTCPDCGAQRAVVSDGRGFPPDIAKRALRKECRAAGCFGEPFYRAGFVVAPRPHGMSDLESGAGE